MQFSWLFEQASALTATSQHFDFTTPSGDVATTVEQLARLAFCLIELDPDLRFFSHRYALRAIEGLHKTEEQ